MGTPGYPPGTVPVPEKPLGTGEDCRIPWVTRVTHDIYFILELPNIELINAVEDTKHICVNVYKIYLLTDEARFLVKQVHSHGGERTQPQ